MAWHARESLTGGRRDGSTLTQVRHGRGRGVGWVGCRGEQLVIRSGHVVVCERACEREWCSNHTSQKLELSHTIKYRDIRTKSVNRFIDRERVSRIATFGICQPYRPGSEFEPWQDGKEFWLVCAPRSSRQFQKPRTDSEGDYSHCALVKQGRALCSPRK